MADFAGNSDTFIAERGDGGACSRERLPTARFPFYSTTLRATIPAGQLSAELRFRAERDMLFNGLVAGGSDTAAELDTYAFDAAVGPAIQNVFTAGAAAAEIDDAVASYVALAGHTYREQANGVINASNAGAAGADSWQGTIERRETPVGGAPGAWVTASPTEERDTNEADEVLPMPLESNVASFTPAVDTLVEFRMVVAAAVTDATVGVNGASMQLWSFEDIPTASQFTDFEFDVAYCNTKTYIGVSAKVFRACCPRKPIFLQGVADNKDLVFTARLAEARESDVEVALTLYGVQGAGCCA